MFLDSLPKKNGTIIMLFYVLGCRCGDEIVAVNGATTVGMNNSSLIPMLKLQRNKVTLTVVSWPGSLV